MPLFSFADKNVDFDDFFELQKFFIDIYINQTPSHYTSKERLLKTVA